MKIFDYMGQFGYEELAFYTDEASGPEGSCLHPRHDPRASVWRDPDVAFCH